MKTFYFSFGHGHSPGIGYYTSIDAEDSNYARRIMVKYWNDKWSFQYDSKEAIGVKKYNLTHVNVEDSQMKTIQFDEITHQTDFSIRFKFDDEYIWIPLSVMGKLNADENTIEVERWFMVNEELDMFEI